MAASEALPLKKDKTRLLLVDDHPIVRQGLAALLNHEPDLQVCGEAQNGAEALTLVNDLRPGLVIVDISLPGSDGIELTKQIRKSFPSVYVLVLSMHEERFYAERALRAGAHGYVMKQEGATSILTAIRRVLMGRIHVNERIQSSMLQQAAERTTAVQNGPVDLLSDRELQIFRLIGRGINTRQIALSLHLSRKTVESHRCNIKSKLMIRAAHELTHYAIQWAHTQEGA